MLFRDLFERIKTLLLLIISIETYQNKDLENQKRADKDGVKAILRHMRVQAHDSGVDLGKEFKERSQNKNGIMSEKEFKDTIKSLRLNVDNNEIQKLVDKYINSVGYSIDTNVLIEHMYDKDARREVSATNTLKSTIEPTIISKIAKKLSQK